MTSRRWRPALTCAAAMLVGVVAAGCSDDGGCAGVTYHPDLGKDGAKTPIEALETWLNSATGLDADAPDEGWTVQDAGTPDPQAVVLTNDDGDGWWVSAARTRSGGWVVDQATDDATGCGDGLSG